MKLKYLFFLSVVLSLMATSCGGGGVKVTPTSMPTAAPEPTQTPQPTKQPGLPDVQLRASDLPEGYKLLTAEEAQSLGLEGIEEKFGASITGGAPSSSAVFVNQSQNDFGIVISILSNPLSAKLITSLAAILSQPKVAEKELLSGANMKTMVVKPEYSGLGDGSIGVTATTEDGFMLDAIIAYRNSAFMMVMYMYSGVSKVDLKTLVQKLDDRVKTLPK